MRKWNLNAGEIARFRLAADARLPGMDYADDHIWDLRSGGGNPAALAVETTYGLRARGMRLFPIITVSGQQAIDPSTFAREPSVHTVLPNYLALSCRPVANVRLQLEYWVHDSHALLGRITVANTGDENLAIDMRLNALLLAGGTGSPFSESQIDGVHVLAGSVDRLKPVVFLEGGARTPPSAFPALSVSTALDPGRSRAWIWAHAAEREQRASFDRARMLCNTAWEPNIARLKLLNAGMVEVETGDETWDAAFWLTQVAALQAFTGPTLRSHHPGLVGRRTIRDGFSPAGDGSDYDGAWAGLDASQAHFIARQIVNCAPELVQGELRNRITAVNSEGELDGCPGPGGQRAGWETIPLLADLTWRTYEQTQDLSLLQQAYPVLSDSVRRWLDKSCDRDQDGFPEWQYLPQTGFSAWPAFVAWQRWGQGLEIAKVERPDLAAYLFAECSALERIADELGETRDQSWFQAVRTSLQESLEYGWSERANFYQSLDRDLNQPLQGERLGRGKGSFKLEIKREFDSPVRVLIRTFGAETKARDLKVKIQGKGRTNRKMVEQFTGRKFQWFWKMGCATAEKMATALDWVKIEGLNDDFSTDVWLADTTRQDVSGLMPLWAGMIPFDRAVRLIEATLLDERHFWRKFGVPTVSARDSAYKPEREGNPGGIWMFANTLIGYGLLRYGYRQRAVELVRKLMPAVVERLQREGDFGTYYHPDESKPLGSQHGFEGLAPLDLFLESLGLRLSEPSRVRVEPGNPYPWPISIRWRGLTVKYQDEQVIIVFPDGASVRVSGEERQWVLQEQR
ncbi:MAG: hypothetical protein P8X64_01705 [Anaerolineales bacterium]